MPLMRRVSTCHPPVEPVPVQPALEKFSRGLWTTDQSFLDDDQMGQGYALLCVSYPTANCTIQSDSQNDFN